MEVFYAHQEWDQATEELMARWCVGDQLPYPSKLKLHVQISNQGSDRKLCVLSFHGNA